MWCTKNNHVLYCLSVGGMNNWQIIVVIIASSLFCTTPTTPVDSKCLFTQQTGEHKQQPLRAIVQHIIKMKFPLADRETSLT